MTGNKNGAVGAAPREEENANDFGSHSSTLCPDRAMAERHLTLLDEGAKRFTFATFTDGKDKPRPDPLAHIRHGTLEKHWPELVELNGRGAGVFVVVNETDGRGAKNENIVRIRAVWQEADRGDEPPLPREPHIIVESSPGKHHRYVLVDGAPLDEFEAVQQRLVDDFGSDPNAKDRRRVLRLSGFLHRKGEPHLVRIVHESGEPPISWDEAKRLLPPVQRARANVSALPELGNPLEKPAEVASALAAIDPDCPYMDWLRCGMALHATGAGREAFDIWEAWSRRGALHKPGECAYRWNTFTRDKGVTLGTLFRMAYRAGWDGKISADPDVLPLVDVQRRRMLTAFNDRHAVAMVDGRAVIVYREFDRGVDRMTTRFSSRGDLATKHEPDTLPFVEYSGNPPQPVIEQKPLVPIWMKSPIRRTYDQIVFKPQPRLVAGPVTLPDGPILNLFQGLAITPKAGDATPILEHIRTVWCSGNDGAYQYVVSWLARMFQRPGERGHTVIVLKSGEGTGKNIIVDLLVRAMGDHATVCTKAEDLTGRFNDHLATAVLVFANEAVWGGDKQQEGALKSLITDEDLPVERKYIPKYRVRNCCHLIMASNNDWVAPVGLDDRRFVILDVAEHRRDDHEYFGALAAHIENGGAEAFVHYLLNLDLGEFNPRQLPDLGLNQATKREAKLRGANSVIKWWAQCLGDEAILVDRTAELPTAFGSRTAPERVDLAAGWADGPIEIRTKDLYEAYRQWANGHRVRVELKSVLGSRLHKYAGVKKVRSWADGNRAMVYHVPSLCDCRHAFEREMRQPWDWGSHS